MNHSDLMALARAVAQGDLEWTKRLLLAAAANSRTKGTHAEVQKILEKMRAIQLGGGVQELVLDVEPARTFADLVHPPSVLAPLQQLVVQQERIDLLHAHGITPWRRILFHGPSGTGKTTTAEALAHALGLRLLLVPLGTLVGSFVGETGARLNKIFRAASTHPGVWFFDECDALLCARGESDSSSAGKEHTRAVCTLLQELEVHPPAGLAIFATNRAPALDPALHRRLDMVLRFDLPSHAEAVTLGARHIPHVDWGEALGPANWGQPQFGGWAPSQADIEAVALDAKRAAILDPAGPRSPDLVDVAAAIQRRRARWEA